jgi:hypothetical protein
MLEVTKTTISNLFLDHRSRAVFWVISFRHLEERAFAHALPRNNARASTRWGGHFSAGANLISSISDPSRRRAR